MRNKLCLQKELRVLRDRGDFAFLQRVTLLKAI